MTPQFAVAGALGAVIGGIVLLVWTLPILVRVFYRWEQTVYLADGRCPCCAVKVGTTGIKEEWECGVCGCQWSAPSKPHSLADRGDDANSPAGLED